MDKKQTYHANGKLLLTGEYAVLDGSLSLALPVNLGQSLHVQSKDSKKAIIEWKAFLHDKNEWFSATFETVNFSILSCTDLEKSKRLSSILKAVKQEKPSFFKPNKQYDVQTHLEFPTEFGLGSSSTLISLIAQWTGTNPYSILNKTFGGSGYDLACATRHSPILYSLKDKKPNITEVQFYPEFSNNIFFVYLNKKQNSREGITHYRKNKSTFDFINSISDLTNKILYSKNIEEFEGFINQHEDLVSNRINLPKVKEQRFPDYSYSVKSLGAWGGDFVMITTRQKNITYFEKAGYKTIFSFKDLLVKT